MKSKKAIVLLILMSVSVGHYTYAQAQATVVDLNQSLEIDQGPSVAPQIPSTANNNHTHEPIDQRVLRLERQITNLNEVNNANKFETIQSQIAKLQGQVEVQNHELLQLKEQLRNYYEDLDQRFAKINGKDSSIKKNSTSLNDNEAQNSKEESTDLDEGKSKELLTYEKAFNLLNKKEYDKAINGFRSFLKAFPASSYSANAHYWLGEIYYLKGKPSQATQEFTLIVNEYPSNPKVADALLKIALIQMDAGNYTKARQNLIKIQQQYKDTSVAKIATLRLKEIKQKK